MTDESAALPLNLLREVIDHSTPMHSAACAAQDDDAPCFCGTGPVMERAYVRLSESGSPPPPCLVCEGWGAYCDEHRPGEER